MPACKRAPGARQAPRPPLRHFRNAQAPAGELAVQQFADGILRRYAGRVLHVPAEDVIAKVAPRPILIPAQRRRQSLYGRGGLRSARLAKPPVESASDGRRQSLPVRRSRSTHRRHAAHVARPVLSSQAVFVLNTPMLSINRVSAKPCSNEQPNGFGHRACSAAQCFGVARPPDNECETRRRDCLAPASQGFRHR